MHPNNLMHRRGSSRVARGHRRARSRDHGVRVRQLRLARAPTPRAAEPSAATVSLVAYSSPQDAYESTLEPGFNKTPEGAEVEFSNSFGASGDQSRAVEAGQPADLVHFSLEPDIVQARRRRASSPTTGTTTSTTASSRTRRWCSSSARATRTTSRPGTTSPAATTRSSCRTRSPRAAPAGTSWPPTARRSKRARRPRRSAAARRGHPDRNRPAGRQRLGCTRDVHVRQGRRAARPTRARRSAPRPPARTSTT